jgi:hypothetical protein
MPHRLLRKPGDPYGIPVSGALGDDVPAGTLAAIRRKAGLP